MKKIIFLLFPLLTLAQNPTNFPYGIKNPAATSDSAPAYFTTSQVDGVHKKTPAANVEKTANKSDSYTTSSSTTYASTKALVDGLAVKSWIKSNESLALAQRKGDVLYGILDQYTGEEMTLSKTTGTPTPDGIIYFQLGSEYFKRNNIETLRVEWFDNDINKALSYGINVQLINGKSYTFPTITINEPNLIFDLNNAVLNSDSSTTTSIRINSNNVKLINGTIDCSNTIGVYHSIILFGNDCTIENLKIINSKNDAIWVGDTEPLLGFGDRSILNNITIINPFRYGIFYVGNTRLEFRDWVIIKNIFTEKSVNTDFAIQIAYISNLSISNLQVKTGYVQGIVLSRVKKGVIKDSSFIDVGNYSALDEWIDLTYADFITIENNYFYGKKVGINPSNTSSNIIIKNNWFNKCSEAIVTYENFSEIFIIDNKFYDAQVGISSTNTSNLSVTNNLFLRCKIGVGLGGNNVDGKVNYTNMVANVSNNIFNITGEQAVRAVTSIADSFYKVLHISNNTIIDAHTITDAEKPSYWSYTSINDSMAAIAIGAVTAIHSNVFIENNKMHQTNQYTTGIQGGGIREFVACSLIDNLHINNNSVPSKYNRAVYLSSNDINNIKTNEFFVTGEFTLSGGAQSIKYFPLISGATFLNVEVTYSVSTSADAGVDILIKDSVTGTVKKTITTLPSQAGQTTTIIKTNFDIVAGRGIEIYTAGTKVGSGKVYIKIYYVSLF